MRITLPIYVEVRQPAGTRHKEHACSTLFTPGLQSAHRLLNHALQRLSQKVRARLEEAAAHPSHEEFARLAFHPELAAEHHKLTLVLGDRTLKCRYLFVEMPAFGRRVAFTPSIRGLWFEIAPGESLPLRAAEALTEYLQKTHPDDAPAFVARTSLAHQAWLTTLELDITTRQRTAEEQESRFAALFDNQVHDGAIELRTCGRCLDWLYPDDLVRAVGRDAEVERLTELLQAPDRRPVLIVGRRLAGKTTVLHECVYRRVEERRGRAQNRRNVWLLAPSRLISGMSFVGQWEGRVTAILDEARQRDHVLYFDDLLGLYEAGISADSRLCVADVLKPVVQRRSVRVLAEMTPEALDVFQQRDRGFADEFEIIRIDDMDEESSLGVLLEVNRRLEQEQECAFALDVLPAVLEIQRRYAPAAALPGKAAAMLARLAARGRGQAVTRADVLDEFRRQTGLRLELLDRDRKLRRNDILAGLRRRMVGQQAALEAVADVISVAKARLNTPGRPLATLLFLGPTGVGKTECAKSIARYLFGGDDRLLRFDMNEFVNAFDATRLIGRPGEPDGLLTGAVRRQPFAVVLFDEIEKAHPDVFDLLLQVTGEARLTDAVGRTTDFSNTLIVMTSNLGTRESASRTGFGRDDPDESRHAFVRAAERFFPPEFFNRFDRLLPFTSLGRDELASIAQHLIREVFRRDGLARRRCLLHIEPEAMQRVIQQGYHPTYGARALKRAIEANLTRPVAERLAALPGDRPTLVRLLPAGEQFLTCVDELLEVDPTELPPLGDPANELAAACRFLDTVGAELEAARPREAISVGGLSTEQLHYFAAKEQWTRVDHWRAALSTAVARRNASTDSPALTASSARRSIKMISQMERGSARRVLREIYSSDDIDAYLDDVTRESSAPAGSAEQPAWDRLRREAALLQTMRPTVTGDDTLVVFQPLAGTTAEVVQRLRDHYEALCRQGFEFDCDAWRGDDVIEGVQWLTVRGAFAAAILRGEIGLHVVVAEDQSLAAVKIDLLPLASAESPREVAARFAAQRRAWLAAVAASDDAPPPDPQPPESQPPGRVVRIYRVNRLTIDLRSGLRVPDWADDQQLREMLLAGLPLPPEWSLRT